MNRYHFLLITTVLILAAHVTSAATVVVNSAADVENGAPANCAAKNFGTCTLRDALATATSGSDTIIFNADMTINLASTLDLSLRSVTIDATGKSVSIDANDAVTVLAVGSKVNVKIKHLTIQHGDTAIANFGILDVSNCALIDNTAIHYAGAIANDNFATLTLSNSVIAGNRARGGGAGILNAGKMAITNSTFFDNISIAGFGGAIFNSGAMTLTESTFRNNSAGLGGGISNGGALALVNSTLSNNHAYVSGGALFNMGSLSIINSTLSDNSAENDGGGISSLSPSLVINSIVAMNTQAEGGDVDSDIDPNSTGNLIGGDPELGTLQNNGGGTETLLPKIGSPAIDAVPCDNAPARDQRGVMRPQGTRCDIGSVEVVKVLPMVAVPGLDHWKLLFLGLIMGLIGCAKLPPRSTRPSCIE